MKRPQLSSSRVHTWNTECPRYNPKHLQWKVLGWKVWKIEVQKPGMLLPVWLNNSDLEGPTVWCSIMQILMFKNETQESFKCYRNCHRRRSTVRARTFCLYLVSIPGIQAAQRTLPNSHLHFRLKVKVSKQSPSPDSQIFLGQPPPRVLAKQSLATAIRERSFSTVAPTI